MNNLNPSRRLSTEEVRHNFDRQRQESIARSKRIAEEVRQAQALRAKNDKMMDERRAQYKANRAQEIEAAAYLKRKESAQITVNVLRDKIQGAFTGRVIRGAGGRLVSLRKQAVG